MKRILFILLLTIPFLGFSQDISGTGWKISHDDGDRTIILFEDDGTFIYLGVISHSGNQGEVFGNDDETWELNGNKIVILFNDGFNIMTGTINRTGDYMSGTTMNKKGKTENWFGELIKFDDVFFDPNDY
tara:strand:- start:725 stop:1114 length:390 start_codon:yes stop_codon:yes gene_type:complete